MRQRGRTNCGRNVPRNTAFEERRYGHRNFAFMNPLHARADAAYYPAAHSRPLRLSSPRKLPERELMDRLSMNELTTYRWSFEEDVRNYAAAGFSAIGVWRQKLSDFGEERGAELLLESGLEVSSLLWAGGFTGSDGRSYRESLQDAEESVRLAAGLHAGCLILFTGSRAG